MRKRWIIILIVIIGIILATFLGIYAYQNGSLSDTNIISDKTLAEVDKIEDKKHSLNQTVSTAAINETISPNATIIEKSYYKKCDHLLRKEINVTEQLINKKEDDIKEKYYDWKIEKYSSTEIIVYKEFEGFCGEHYIARELDGVIAIYTLDGINLEKLKEKTEISTQYLPEEDIEKLKEGISIIGRANLYKFLEDYE